MRFSTINSYIRGEGDQQRRTQDAQIVKSTTLGNFVMPPAKAEEMYMPETFGRRASDRMIVE
jgi:uncharacterized protein YfaS (alpha-2-macroglobulin family)